MNNVKELNECPQRWQQNLTKTLDPASSHPTVDPSIPQSRVHKSAELNESRMKSIAVKSRG
jgi:hypothetical protein